jgi:hypothetical protein
MKGSALVLMLLWVNGVDRVCHSVHFDSFINRIHRTKKMKSYIVDIKRGDKIEVGRFRNVVATVLDIETDEHGQPVIITSKGKKKLFTCRITKLSPGAKTPKQILLESKRKKKT